jgi:hypothetical protein
MENCSISIKKSEAIMIQDFVDNAIENGTAKGIKCIGLQVSFKNSTKDYRQDKVIDGYKLAGLDYSHISKGQNRIRIIERALQKAKQGNLLREIENNAEFSRYQFTQEFINENSDGLKFVDFKVSDFITYNKKDNKILCENSDKQLLIERLMDYCGDTFTVNDVSRYIKKSLQEFHLVPIINSGGGSFFIPIQFKDEVNKVKEAFKFFDPKGIFHITHIYCHDEEKESMTENVNHFKLDKLAKIKEKFEALIASGDGISKTVKKNAVEELAYEMKDIEFYSDLLEIEFKEAKELNQKMAKVVEDFYLGNYDQIPQGFLNLPEGETEGKKDTEPSIEELEAMVGI